jgi:uroporphyrinogen decarboxylase
VTSPFTVPVTPDAEAFENCIARRTSPRRVHHVELFLDGEIQQEIVRRFDVMAGVLPDDPFYDLRWQVELQRFLGYDYVKAGPEGLDMTFNKQIVPDTAELAHETGRSYQDEHTGPIQSWEDFEKYPWPDPEKATTRALEWYEKNLPDDMCVIGGLCGHFAEHLMWLFGYESLCFALFEKRDLVQAVADRILEIDRVVVRRILQFDRVRFVWGSDDMGFKTQPLISPDDMRTFVLPGHKTLAAMTHEAGRTYLLHSCGKLDLIMEDLIQDVGIDAKHSYEDAIENVADFHARYGDRIAVLGGIDVDFLCRASEDRIRARVRETLAACHGRGGYCLGSGNSVANYVPVDAYLAMLDEGRKFTA